MERGGWLAVAGDVTRFDFGLGRSYWAGSAGDGGDGHGRFGIDGSSIFMAAFDGDTSE